MDIDTREQRYEELVGRVEEQVDALPDIAAMLAWLRNLPTDDLGFIIDMYSVAHRFSPFPDTTPVHPRCIAFDGERWIVAEKRGLTLRKPSHPLLPYSCPDAVELRGSTEGGVIIASPFVSGWWSWIPEDRISEYRDEVWQEWLSELDWDESNVSEEALKTFTRLHRKMARSKLSSGMRAVIDNLLGPDDDDKDVILARTIILKSYGMTLEEYEAVYRPLF